MRNISFVFILAQFIVILSGCQRRTDYKQLLKIDSLCCSEKYEEALEALENINEKALSTSNKIDYYLLTTMVSHKLYIPMQSDTIIKECISYYASKGVTEKLMQSYLFESIFLIEKGEWQQALLMLKEIEEVTDKIQNEETIIKAFVYLGYINAVSNNTKLALEYANKALNFADKKHNRRWMGYCFQNLSTIAALTNEIPNDTFTIKSIEFIEDQPNKEKAIYLKNIGVDYFEKGNYVKCEEYLVRSLDVEPRVETYGCLADVYAKQGKLDEAGDLWKSAINTDNLRLKVAFMTSYVDWLREKGDYKAEAEYSRELIALKDSLARWQQTEATREIQEQYDREVAERKHQVFVNRLLWIMALMTVIVFGVFAFAHFRGLKAKKQLAESNALAAEYSAQIERLKAEGKEQTKEAKELQGKLEKLRAEQNEILYHGKQLYDHLMKEGGNAATWHKTDFTDFVEYYRTIDMPFVVHLENDYQKLSPSNKTILIFQHLGYTDQQILYLMGMTDGALRTTKSRIKGRRKE